MSKYIRQQPSVTRNSDNQSGEDSWLGRMQKNLEKDAVQPRTVDQTLFHQINTIMNGKSKYPSVEAAVEDMKNRSGLTAYLDKINKVSETEIDENQTKIAEVDPSENKTYYNRGLFDAKFDLINDEASDILSSILAQNKTIPISGWKDYALGYADGAKFDKETLEHELNLVNHAIKQYSKTASDQNNAKSIPLVVKKCPQIKDTLQNYIKDTRGNLPISAIIEKIRSIHSNDVSEAKDWEDDNLLKLISQLNLKEKQNNPSNFETYHNLGRRDIDSNDIDQSNTDAFHALTPVKF